MKTYQLTQHFALNEFTRSAIANAHGIDNSLDLTKADDRMVADIQPLWNVETRHATSLREWFHFIQDNCRFDQLILETQGGRQWIHVSTCRDDARCRQACMTLKR